MVTLVSCSLTTTRLLDDPRPAFIMVPLWKALSISRVGWASETQLKVKDLNTLIRRQRRGGGLGVELELGGGWREGGGGGVEGRRGGGWQLANY